MTIVELPDNNKEAFIYLYNDRELGASVWATGVEVKAMEHGQWHITIYKGGGIAGFIYADAIRRK